MPADKILVTGAAGFIGYHTSERLLRDGYEVVALDNVNSYYDVSLKEARIARLLAHPGFRLYRVDLCDQDGVERVFRRERPARVIHLAAQAGVRHSLSRPHVYAHSNITGFLHILEGCRHHGVAHLGKLCKEACVFEGRNIGAAASTLSCTAWSLT
jgi:UDP-glucuronate 4-epimerase